MLFPPPEPQRTAGTGSEAGTPEPPVTLCCAALGRRTPGAKVRAYPDPSGASKDPGKRSLAQLSSMSTTRQFPNALQPKVTLA